MSDANGWRPIETAPRDGTPVLLFDQLVGSLIAFWEKGEWVVSWNHDEIPDQQDLTHWQPLPPPPEADREDAP